jgi:hypothetical protein
MCNVNRRNFLLASGAGLLASESATAATMMAPAKLKKNVVLVSVDHGLFERNFREGKQDCRYMNQYFKDFKKKVTYFSGMGQPGVSKGHHSEHATFTCMNFQDRALYPNRQFVSLDQYIAENSLQETRHKNIFHKVTDGRNMSWNTKAQAAPAYLGIDSLHAGLFGTVDEKKVKAGLSKQRIILKELKTNIKRRWKGTPQEKNLVSSIDYQLKELDTREKWMKVRRPRKAAKHPNDAFRSPLINSAYNYDTIFEALKEKQTKIAMIQFGSKGMTQNLPGLSHGYHTLTHHSYYSERTEELSTIDGHVLKGLAGFLEKLETENMLDDTIVLFTCAMSDANKHSGKNIPAFLFGGGFKHKSCIECSDGNGQLIKPTAMLFSSILKQIGFHNHQFSGNKEVFNELFKA